MNALAQALIPTAHRALSLAPVRPSEDEPMLLAALTAVDHFVANPSASRYLVAHRSLNALARLRGRSPQIERLATRSVEAELGRLRTRALLPDSSSEGEVDPIAVLAGLPPDPRAGRRLQALAALLEAHRALALRVRAPEAHRARLTKPDASGSGAAGASRRRPPRKGQPAPDRRSRSGR
jgi:hypothetical protein